MNSFFEIIKRITFFYLIFLFCYFLGKILKKFLIAIYPNEFLGASFHIGFFLISLIWIIGKFKFKPIE